MWCEWMDLKRINMLETPLNEISSLNDPWEAQYTDVLITFHLKNNFFLRYHELLFL